MSKKVLIITYYWPPAGGGGVQRWVKFTKYLRDYGWEPVVFTVKNADYPILDEQLGDELPEGLEVIKTPIYEPYDLYKRWSGKKKTDKIDANFLSQGKKLGLKEKIAVWIRGNLFIPDAKVWWIKPAVKRLNQYLKDHPMDAMISTGPPHTCHLIAKGIQQYHSIPWIVDYRDQWTQIDYFEDLQLTKWAENKHKRLEKAVLDACDVIVSVGKTIAKDLEPISSTRKVVITNGFDDADRNEATSSLDDTFSIVYIGTMNDARNPEALWQAVAQLRDESHPMMNHLNIKLVGKPEATIRQSVEQHGLNAYVHFVGYVTHKEAIAYQNQARILLLIINRTSNNGSILTGKIFEYVASGRPILLIGPKDGDAADILLHAGQNSIFDYQDVQEIKAYILEQYAIFTKEKNKVPSYTLSDKTQQYSRKNLTQKLVNVLEDISSSHRKNSIG
ncbi:MAG: glycosyltransferase family 4 protein [Chitinophagales bacterium]|nr:glycosyltransferase family 4 protein [Chitinophagales bacterium]